jgi:1,4-alpha-glucan branching enzyme
MKRGLLIFNVVIFLFLGCKKDPKVPSTTQPPVEISGSTLISTSVDFPGLETTFTLSFDASKGNEGLNNFSGDVFIYTGLITDKSTGPTDWKYVKSSSFNLADPASKMSSTGSGKYQITINPKSFYNVPANEKVLKMVMLFRNADGSKVARNSDQSDIFLTLFDPLGVQVKFTNPLFEPTNMPTPKLSVQAIGEEFIIAAQASKSVKLELSLNGNVFASTTGTIISGKTKIVSAGQQFIKVSATDGNNTAESVFNFVVSGTVESAALPAGAKEGLTFINGGQSAIFALYAPNKQNIYVIGDFNDWQANQKQFMKLSPDAKTWWIQIDNLDPSKTYAYQYLIDGKLKIADPYSEKILDPNNDKYIPASNHPQLPPYPLGKTSGIVSLMQSNQSSYTWKNTSFKRPAKDDLVIYELHLRDFLKNSNYAVLKDTLNYLSRLGVNAIELMPVNEFEGNSSWGYNPSFYFAPDKYYGTKQSLQAFIDECHSRGIAVILDMVLNHSFGQSPMVQMYFNDTAGKPSANSPWFNADPTHPFNVGYDFNHESPATKSFTKNVIKFWMEQYKIDGFRFDLSKGFTQKNSGTSDASVTAWSAYDASRLAIWKEYNSFIKGLDANNFYVILEHFAADAEEKALSDEGMMFWNNVNYNFSEASMGFINNSNFSRAFYSTHTFNKSENLITYMESHDEERVMFKNLNFGNSSGSYSVKNLSTALKRKEMSAAFLFSIPGPKMIWQFGELGYDVSIDNNGRTGEKPIRWEYKLQTERNALYNAYSRFIRMKKSNPIFSNVNTNTSYNLGSSIKHIKLEDGNNVVIIVGNFDLSPKAANIDFGNAGLWYNASGGSNISLNSTNFTETLAPGEYHIYSKKVLN